MEYNTWLLDMTYNTKFLMSSNVKGTSHGSSNDDQAKGTCHYSPNDKDYIASCNSMWRTVPGCNK